MKKAVFQKPAIASAIMVPFLAAAVLIGPCHLSQQPPQTADNAPADTSDAVITQIIDGDSVRDAAEREIRLTGINAPEWGEPFSEKAKQYLKNLLLNKKVTLIYGNNRKDKYGRCLTHILIQEGKKKLLAGEELIRRGLANVYIIPPNFLFRERLIEAQKEAIEKQLGIWSLKVKSEEFYVVTSFRFHRPSCRHIKNRNNPETMKDRTEILKLGKSPCRTCKP